MTQAAPAGPPAFSFPGSFPGAFAELMAIRGGPPPEGEVSVTGADPFYRTPFRIGETVAAVLAATGVAAGDLWELRTGRRQRVAVSVREAAATLRVSEYTKLRGADGAWRPAPHSPRMEHMRQITQPWPTADGHYVLPHFNLPHLEKRVLGVLGAESTVDSVRAAVARRTADELEEAIAAARGCGGRIRTREEWLAHPQGAFLAAQPVVTLTKVADSAPVPLGPGERPLSGVRVLDLTRILAGPTAGRTLGEHGADVLMVAHPDLPQVPEYVRDLSHGKRSCFLDLNAPADAARFRELVRGADVFLNGYRPGRLGARGFGVEALARLRPGIINVSVSCFGQGGPFSDRAGWEQVAQAVSGICHTHGHATGAGRPKLAPAPMNDYVTGYLGAFGALVALRRRAQEGGSWNVSVSLCQSALFYWRQGLLEGGFMDAPEWLAEDETQRLYVREDGYVQEDGAYGGLLTLGPVLEMSETPCFWALPTPRFGGDRAEWAA